MQVDALRFQMNQQKNASNSESKWAGLWSTRFNKKRKFGEISATQEDAAANAYISKSNKVKGKQSATSNEVNVKWKRFGIDIMSGID